MQRPVSQVEGLYSAAARDYGAALFVAVAWLSRRTEGKLREEIDELA
jgi:hypothetical protein